MKGSSERLGATDRPGDRPLIRPVQKSAAFQASLFATVCGILDEVKCETGVGQPGRFRRNSELAPTPQAKANLATLNEHREECEQRFHLLVENLEACAVVMLSPRGDVVTWSKEAERIKGYRSEEIIGKHCSGFYTAEDIRAGKPERALKVAAVEGRYEDEGWRVRKDGSRFWAKEVVAALSSDGSVKGYLKVLRDDSRRKESEEVVCELSGRLLQLRDEERARLGRELHDSTAQTLGALSINLALLKEYLKSSASPAVAQVLSEITDLTQQASREIRNVAYLLRPPMLEEAGLRRALARLVDGFVERTKIQVSLEIEPGLGRLPKNIELAFFRVVQESLTNVYRHSGSPTARVRLSLTSRGITLEVSDDGKGLQANTRSREEALSPTPGVGISGMRERMRQLGGTLDVGSGNPGVTVRALIPLESVSAEPVARFTSEPAELVSLTSEPVESA